LVDTGLDRLLFGFYSSVGHHTGLTYKPINLVIVTLQCVIVKAFQVARYAKIRLNEICVLAMNIKGS
jgi:hypothetical protein